MKQPDREAVNRRDVLKTSAVALGAAAWLADSLEAYPKAVNTSSSPSALRITDLRRRSFQTSYVLSVSANP